ncbi:MAG: RNA-binding protein [Chloroflexi bacterium]|jgi:RNA recognition motif-containing protein|nr:RNA-binding protein [Chloroflexota bacterium]
MNTKLYVGNLPFETSEHALRTLFAQAGNIVSVTIPLDRMSNRPRGFAFVEMGSSEEARKAIQMFNGRDFEGRTMNVSEARPPEQRSAYGNTRNSFGRDRRGRGNDRRY